MGTLRYRVRLRNLADTEDLWVATSVRNGTHPYIKSAPRSDGQEVDPITGRVTQGATTIEIIDWWGDLCLFPPDSVIEDTTVASVAIAESLSLIDGETGTLAAVVRNAIGQKLTDKVVTWASDTPLVATAGADSGTEAHQSTIAAVDVGTADITATCETVDSNICAVTVTEAEDPPGSGTGDVYAAFKFDTGDKSETMNGWSFVGGNPTVQPIPAALPGGLATTYALRHRHTTGNGNQEQRFIMGQNLTGLFIGRYFWIPDNYFHRDGPSSDNNKWTRLWSGNMADGKMGYSQYHVKGGFSTDPTSPVTGDSRMRCEYGFSNSGCGQDGVGQRGTGFTPVVFEAGAGRWYKIVEEIRLSSAPGMSDGVLRMWVDDVLVADHDDLDFYSRCPSGSHYFNRGYIEGASNSGWNSTTDLYTARLRFAPTYADADPDNTTGWA